MFTWNCIPLTLEVSLWLSWLQRGDSLATHLFCKCCFVCLANIWQQTVIEEKTTLIANLFLGLFLFLTKVYLNPKTKMLYIQYRSQCQCLSKTSYLHTRYRDWLLELGGTDVAWKLLFNSNSNVVDSANHHFQLTLHVHDNELTVSIQIQHSPCWHI